MDRAGLPVYLAFPGHGAERSWGKGLGFVRVEVRFFDPPTPGEIVLPHISLHVRGPAATGWSTTLPVPTPRQPSSARVGGFFPSILVKILLSFHMHDHT